MCDAVCLLHDAHTQLSVLPLPPLSHHTTTTTPIGPPGNNQQRPTDPPSWRTPVLPICTRQRRQGTVAVGTPTGNHPGWPCHTGTTLVWVVCEGASGTQPTGVVSQGVGVYVCE